MFLFLEPDTTLECMARERLVHNSRHRFQFTSRKESSQDRKSRCEGEKPEFTTHFPFESKRTLSISVFSKGTEFPLIQQFPSPLFSLVLRPRDSQLPSAEQRIVLAGEARANCSLFWFVNRGQKQRTSVSSLLCYNFTSRRCWLSFYLSALAVFDRDCH